MSMRQMTVREEVRSETQWEVVPLVRDLPQS